jgi:hypothetical protein
VLDWILLLRAQTYIHPPIAAIAARGSVFIQSDAVTSHLLVGPRYRVRREKVVVHGKS